jgi:hypothetical protein
MKQTSMQIEKIEITCMHETSKFGVIENPDSGTTSLSMLRDNGYYDAVEKVAKSSSEHSSNFASVRLPIQPCR